MSAERDDLEKKGWMSDLVNQVEERAKAWNEDLRYQLDSSIQANKASKCDSENETRSKE